MHDVESFLLGTAAGSGGGGGGNPNYVEFITGTLANPWGDVDVEAIASQCLTDDATMYLLADATALGMQEIELALQREGITKTLIAFGSVRATSGDNVSLDGVLAIFRKDTGAVTDAVAQIAGIVSNLLPYANQITTALTIIHHPLP